MASTPRKPAPPRPARAEAPAAAPLAPPFPLLSYGELAGLGEAGLAASAGAHAALTEGMEALAREAMGGARLAFQSAAEAARGLLGAKTLEDVLRLQAAFARRNLDSGFASAAKLAAIGWALAGAALLPPSRVASVTEKSRPPLLPALRKPR